MHDHEQRSAHFLKDTSPPQALDYQQAMNQTKVQRLQHQQYQTPHPLPPSHHHHHQQTHQHHQQHFLQQQQHQQQQQQQHQQRNSQLSQFQLKVSDEGGYSHTAPPSSKVVFEEAEFEDVDDEDISDMEEEEELRQRYEYYRQSLRKPDVTSQLLTFAEAVSSDIRKLFGRARGQDDACDVYEDKWAATKSGRELYYADLLRIAQGDTEVSSRKTKDSSRLSPLSTSSISSSLSPPEDFDNRSKFSGKMDANVGMGPLSELFEFGSKSIPVGKRSEKPSTFSKTKGHSSSRSGFGNGERLSPRNSGIPMHDRNFPDSFWREPRGLAQNFSENQGSRSEVSQHSMLTSSKLPDFSDLVESWQGVEASMGSSVVGRAGRTDFPVEPQRL